VRAVHSFTDPSLARDADASVRKNCLLAYIACNSMPSVTSLPAAAACGSTDASADSSRTVAPQISLTSSVGSIETELESAGIFYDDPAQVPAERCRSRAAAFLPDDQIRSCELPVMKIDVQQALNTSFPYLSMISIFIAVAKVYPALKRACQERNMQHSTVCIEIYDKPRRVVEYYALRRPI
jgi:hypothetical protein